MFITTFHRWFPPPLRLNLAMAAARCFAGWDAARCSALGAGREVLPGPHVWTLSRRFGAGNVVFYMWNFVWNPVTWDICLVWTKWAFCLKMFCHAMHVFSEFAAFIWFRDACRQGIQMGQGKSTRIHYFPWNSGRFWEVRHRYIDMVKVCFLGNLYQHTSGLSNWLWKHCYSPAWHLCISVLSVLWVSVNSFFQLHVGKGTNPIILMLGKMRSNLKSFPRTHNDWRWLGKKSFSGWQKWLLRIPSTWSCPTSTAYLLKNLIVFIQ